MKKINGGFNTPAIVISRQKHKLYSIFTFITPSLGLIRASLPHKRLKTLRNSSYLRPFSAMYITVVPAGEYVNITQIDGSYVVKSLDQNLDNIGYAAVASELIQELFALYDVDRQVFDTVVNYSKQIRRRNVQLGTIMLGWQLLSLAGIVPKSTAFTHNDGIESFWLQLRESTKLSISHSVQVALPQILGYQWGEATPIELSRSTWKELERLLVSYSSLEIGKELQSVKFLTSIL